MKILGLGTAVALLISTGCHPSQDKSEQENVQAEEAVRAKVAQEIYLLDRMRSTLASAMQNESVDEQTFTQVCKPVGKQAARLGADNGWTIRQIALKYRNPANAPGPEDEALLERLLADPSIDSLWIEGSIDGQDGMRYLRRMTVEPACLACHGPKDARPEFVKSNYPEDRAFDFRPGELRGIYSVFVPAVRGVE